MRNKTSTAAEIVPSVGFTVESPTIVFRKELQTMREQDWANEQCWVDSVSSMPEILAIILPLELRATGKLRQRMHGIRLLYWLRWSAEDPIKFLPVLVLSWQSPQKVLRKSGQLLLVSDGTQWVRLPDLDSAVSKFVDAVRGGQAEHATISSVKHCAGTSAFVRSVTYHTLANDSYAAYRIWCGYKHAIETALDAGKGDAELEQERKRVAAASLECVATSERNLRLPWIREFQSASEGLGVPAYPQVEFPESLLREHVKHGLPQQVRILFVDDQFDTGLAEALLQIVFRTNQFTICRPDEWIYSEQMETSPTSVKARLVCVRSVPLAQFWLSRWGVLDYTNSANFSLWLGQWQQELFGTPLKAKSADVIHETFAGRARIIDNDSAQPVRMTTVVLLDLRLNRDLPEDNYDIRQFASVQLKNEIKSASSDTVVLMFTASRQASAFAEVMTDSSRADGWLIKEAPDMRPDDDNSQRAVSYLLAALHLYAATKDWLKPEFGWSRPQILQYSELYATATRQDSLEYVSHESTRLFKMVKENTMAAAVRSRNRGLLGFVQEAVPIKRFSLERRLVCRRIVVATLLWTSKLAAGNLVWQPGEFVYHIRGDDRRQVKTVYGSQAINFAEALWFSSSRQDILRLLLPEEREWLLNEMGRWSGLANIVHCAKQLLG